MYSIMHVELLINYFWLFNLFLVIEELYGKLHLVEDNDISYMMKNTIQSSGNKAMIHQVINRVLFYTA